MITGKSIWGEIKDRQDNDVLHLVGSGAPTNGTSGTAANLAGIGSTYTDYTNGVLYYNNNTKASPTWAPFSLEDVTGDVAISGGVSTIGANKVTSAMLATSVLQVATGTISSANITGTSAGQLGHANGVILVPAGGAHVINQLVAVMAVMDFITAAYTGGGNTTINIGGGGAALTGLLSNVNFIQVAADKIVEFLPLSVNPNVYTENNSINMVTTAAPTQPGTAAGVIRWACIYPTFATGL